MSILIYNNIAIRDRGDMLNLTDMWRAAGSPENKRPAQWRRLPDTERRIRHLMATENVGKSHIISGERGRNGETVAHWKLALEYAEDLSDGFWSWAKDAVRAHMEERSLGPTGGLSPEIIDAIDKRVRPLETMVADVLAKLNAALDVPAIVAACMAHLDDAVAVAIHRAFPAMRPTPSVPPPGYLRFPDFLAAKGIACLTGRQKSSLSKRLASFCKRHGFHVEEGFGGAYRGGNAYPIYAMDRWWQEGGAALVMAMVKKAQTARGVADTPLFGKKG